MPHVDPVDRAEYQRNYRKTHREKFRGYDAARSTEERERRRASARRYYQKNRDALVARHREYNAMHRSDFRERELKRVYGMTLHDYDVLLKKQGGVCAICGAAPKVGRHPRTLAVDHDHVTGKVRGLLCTACNVNVGVFEGPKASAIRLYLESTHDD